MLPLNQMLVTEKLMADKAILGTMNLFGIIVYTEEHPYIVKMLRDKDFWRSLNSRTKGWILYAIRPDDNYLHLTEEYLLPELGIQDTKILPQLIILAATPEGEMKQQNYPINDIDVNTAYRSLERAIEIITTTASKIIPSERNGSNVFREVASSLQAELSKSQWKRVSVEFVKFIRWIIGMKF